MASLGIDAVNIQGGGGLTHLIEVVEHAEPQNHGFDEVIVFGGKNLDQIGDHPWLNKQKLSDDRIGVVQQISWNRWGARKKLGQCDVVFAPGTTFSDRSVRYVALPQNMLVFDSAESGRFPLGWTRARYKVLRSIQSRSIRNSVGNIFLSNHAFSSISKFVPSINVKPYAIIHHGVNKRFLESGRVWDLSYTSGSSKTIEILYVSTVNFYKHQWNVVEAVARLRKNGYPVQLKIVGTAHPKAMIRLQQSLAGKQDFVEYVGEVEYTALHQEYVSADIFVFASTCENMPNILLEAMASGLPIACSDYPPMPEFLKKCGTYFDPISVDSIEETLQRVILDDKLRKSCSQKALAESKLYSWNKTADETFQFLSQCITKVAAK